MADLASSNPADASGIQARLHQLAQLLRQADHLDPAAQNELAAVIEELTHSVGPASIPQSDLAHLSESLAHLLEALRHPQQPGLLSGAKNRLEEAAVRTQTDAPLAMGLIHRLIAALADLGI